MALYIISTEALLKKAEYITVYVGEGNYKNIKLDNVFEEFFSWIDEEFPFKRHRCYISNIDINKGTIKAFSCSLMLKDNQIIKGWIYEPEYLKNMNVPPVIFKYYKNFLRKKQFNNILKKI